LRQDFCFGKFFDAFQNGITRTVKKLGDIADAPVR
jgi:hypothetical protein